MGNLTINRPVETWGEFLGLWPTVAAFAGDLGVPTRRVRGWLDRKSVPPSYFEQIGAAACDRGIKGATASFLEKLRHD